MIMVRDGVEVICEIRVELVDLVIVDYSMLCMIGGSLICMFLFWGFDGPVIFLSGDVDEDMVLDVFEYGLIEFIRKFFRIVELSCVIHVAIGVRGELVVKDHSLVVVSVLFVPVLFKVCLLKIMLVVLFKVIIEVGVDLSNP